MPQEQATDKLNQAPMAPTGGQSPATQDDAALASVSQELQGLPLADNLVDWLGFLRRQWLLMSAVWVLAMVLVVVALWFWPRQYESSAKFLVKNARQEFVVGPSENGTVYREDLSETVMNTELELLRSRDIMAQVVSELHLDQPLLDDGRPPEMASEMAIRSLWGGLSAFAIRRTNIIQVSYTSRDPERAASIVQHVADAYLAAHLVVHSSPGTYELFKSQADDASVELHSAEEELAALARSSNLVILDAQKQEALKTVQDLDTELNALAAAMREQDTRARIADVHLLQTPQRVATIQREVPSASIDRLNTMLVELRNKRTQTLTKFQSNDRLVLELDQQIADTSAALERAERTRSNEESTNINPAWQTLDEEKTKARLQLAGLESRSAQLKRELVDQQQRLLEISEAGPRYEQLARRVAEAKNKYELFARKQEEARIAEVLDRQRISNVVLAQAPVVSYVPSKPNVRLGLVAGVILAAFLALGVGFLRELLGLQVSRERGNSTNVSVLGIPPASAELP